MSSTLSQADQHYTESRFADAYAAYCELHQRGEIPPERRAEVTHRCCVCLARLKRWGPALTCALGFVRENRDTVWEPRGLYWLGRLYLAQPEMGFRRGDEILRGGYRPGSEAPGRVRLGPLNLRHALDALEAARVLFPRYRDAHATVEEEIQLNFDLARLVQLQAEEWIQAEAWRDEAAALGLDPEADTSLTEEYAPEWTPIRKLRFLYRQIRELTRLLPADEADEDGRLAQARALVGEAVWLHAYHRAMSIYCHEWQDHQLVRLPVSYPLEECRPEPLLEQLLLADEDPYIRSLARFTLTALTGASGDLRATAAQFGALIAEEPPSRWTRKAAYHLRVLQHPHLSLTAENPQLPGTHGTVSLHHRNMERVRFTVRRFDLAKLFAAEPEPGESRLGLDMLLREPARWEPYCGDVAVEWDLELGSPDHEPHEQKVPVPVRAPGVYLVEARAGRHEAAALLFMTDLLLVQKAGNAEALYWTANAVTGRPEAGVEIEVAGRERKAGQIRRHRLRSDGDGWAVLPISASDYDELQVLARSGERYATVGERFGFYSPRCETMHAACISDRQIYRPGQAVHYRLLLFRRDAGRWLPVPGHSIQLQVTDPRQQCVAEQGGVTDEFGAVHGEVILPEEATLGTYRLEPRFDGAEADPWSDRSVQIEVEEYRRPDFAVQVSSPLEGILLGAEAALPIRAHYYSGGPVAEGAVRYRVLRKRYEPYFRFPDPADCLQRQEDAGLSSWWDEEVARGEAVLDADGGTVLRIATAVNSDSPTEHYRYTVEVVVEDAGARVVAGSGFFLATTSKSVVLLRATRGFFRRGVPVTVEVLTLDPVGRPRSVSGQAAIYRREVMDYGPIPESETPLWTTQLQTDDQGRGQIEWPTAEPGSFRVLFRTDPEGGVPAEGYGFLQVAGLQPEAPPGFRPVLGLFVEQRHYAPGESARVLLVTPEPDCTVLFTAERDGALTRRDVLHVPGRELELDFPLDDAGAGYLLSAFCARGGVCTEASAAVWIPPLSRVLSLTAAPDREAYAPGETVRLALEACDAQGRPAQGEFSVAVVDASVGALARSRPDLRAALYGGRVHRSVGTSNSASLCLATYQCESEVVTAQEEERWALPRGMGRVPDWPGVDKYQTPDFSAHYSLANGEFLPWVHQMVFCRRSDAAEVHGEFPNVPVRQEFLDTAFWSPAVRTDAKGKAELSIPLPDNLTHWEVLVVGTTREGLVGQAATSLSTRKGLRVRLETPRFLVDGDQVLLTAAIRSELPAAQPITARLELEGPGELLAPGMGGWFASAEAEPHVHFELPAGGERRVSWAIGATAAGDLQVRVTAQGATAGDAVAVTVPVLVRGVEQWHSENGMLHREPECRVPITLPRERREGSGAVVVQLSTSLVGVMLDALPYLIQYPYGCVEQTVSRFVPAVLVRQVLPALGWDSQRLRERTRSRQSSHISRRRYAGSPYTYPTGEAELGPAAERSAAPGADFWDEGLLDEILAAGMERLRAAQRPDGGWGWWRHADVDPSMTAYVVEGLLLARSAGIPVDPALLDRGAACLSTSLDDKDPHLAAWTARLLAGVPEYADRVRTVMRQRFDPSDARRPPLDRAWLAQAWLALGDRPRAEELLRQLDGMLRVHLEAGTASLPPPSAKNRLSWFQGETVVHAALLEAYLALQPDAPAVPLLMRRLVNLRRGALWSCTRDTAVALSTLARTAALRGELAEPCTAVITPDGQSPAVFSVNPGETLLVPIYDEASMERPRAGEQSLTIRKEGSAPLYYTVSSRWFAPVLPDRGTGTGLQLRRRYFRVERVTAEGPRPSTAAAPLAGAAALYQPGRPNPFLTRNEAQLMAEALALPVQGIERTSEYRRVALQAGDRVPRGSLLEVEIELYAEQECQYLIFEDVKPAGCEPESPSSVTPGRVFTPRVEYRDQKVVFFQDWVGSGKKRLTYRLRAELPGRYEVLPVNGYTMYTPEIRALSSGMVLEIG